MLEIACGAAKNKFAHLRTIVGIAIDAPKFTARNAEDFILMRCEDWPDELRLRYERANQGFTFFNTDALVSRKVRVTEFPGAKKDNRARSKQPKTGRNELCPCGSGKKYKKCCIEMPAG